MTKADLVEGICADAGLTRKEAAEAVERVLEAMKSSLARGEDLRLSGFGTFVVRRKKARAGRNPRTGTSIELPARTVLTFRISKVLKESLNRQLRARVGQA